MKLGLSTQGELQGQGAGSTGTAHFSEIKTLRLVSGNGDGVELSGQKVGVLSINPFWYRKDRDTVRVLHAEGKLPFIEVHVNTPIATCEQRDPKGLYKKARAGQLKGFTGIDDPYEAPDKPELTIDATNTSPQQATVLLLEYLQKRGILT